ncbi:ABC transporter permease [Paenibacillaceae bacterium]|nr:ABC transporter permease [Paenibacillaceae bacterium]
MASKLRSIWPPAAVIVALLVVWQLAVWVFGIEAWLLPGPDEIYRQAAAIWPRLWEHVQATIRLAALGFTAGVAVGIVLAALLHLIPGARAGAMPLLVLSQNVPTIVLYPLLMIWFGLGLMPKLLLIVLVCFFPVAVSMLGGLAQSDPRLMNYMQMIGASKWQIFRRLELPHAVPYLFTGLKIAATYSITGVIVAEWMGASKGVGYFIKLSSSSFMTARVFAGVLIIVVLSLAVFGIIALLERWFIRWRPRKEAGPHQ